MTGMSKEVRDRLEGPMKVHWYLAQEAPDTAKMAGALGRHSIPFTLLAYNKLERNYPVSDIRLGDNTALVLFGTIHFCRIMSGRFYTPGAYGYTKEISPDHYMTKMDPSLFLNADGFIIPFGMFERDPELYMRMVDPDRTSGVFYRPVDPYKPWVGTTQTWFSPHDEIALYRKTFRIDPLSHTIIAKRKDILREYRFVIVNREVITGSSYEWFDSTSEDSELFQKAHAEEPSEQWYGRAMELARRVAREEFQPDVAYTCDVARITGDDPYRVVELNSFSSAGMYDCDLDKVVLAVSRQAHRDYVLTEMDMMEDIPFP